MGFENRKKVIAVNAILLAVLFGLVSLNKEILRPALNNSGFLKVLTGCFPNFIAAYLISLAFVSAVLIRKLKHGRLIVYSGSLGKMKRSILITLALATTFYLGFAFNSKNK